MLSYFLKQEADALRRLTSKTADAFQWRNTSTQSLFTLTNRLLTLALLPVPTATHVAGAKTHRWRSASCRPSTFALTRAAGPLRRRGPHYFKSPAVKQRVRDQQILTSGLRRLHSDAILANGHSLPIAAPARQFGISSVYLRHFSLWHARGNPTAPCPIFFPLFLSSCRRWHERPQAQIVHLTS